MADQQQISGWAQNDHYQSISDPERWKKTRNYLAPKKILLIDRDGVINQKAKQGEYITDWGEFEWIIDTRNAMKLLAENGFQFIVVSNQAGIARGMFNLYDLERMYVLIIGMKNAIAESQTLVCYFKLVKIIY